MNMKNIKNEKVLLTVFTPTYNRAYCLNLCYESLKRQTCNEFIWLIIDDGSTDNTRKLAQKWLEEDVISIEYIYQNNQGMHGAHNTAYENCKTELNICIDSDDYMTNDAVEKIISFWKINGGRNYSGMIALDVDKCGRVIGTELPSDREDITLSGFYANGGKGDKKLIYRTDIMKELPRYPLFEGEKYVGLTYKYILADQKYTLLIMNEPVCIVEYMEDGSSLNIINQYRKNPRGFAEFRKVTMKYAPTFKERFRECIHFVSSSIMIKNSRFLMESPCKLTTLVAIPFGFMLYIYVMNTSKNSVFKGLKKEEKSV